MLLISCGQQDALQELVLKGALMLLRSWGQQEMLSMLPRFCETKMLLGRLL